ncbi:hypothetical protein CO662_32875 [Rhizobium anhuiense]|uniref:Lipid A biosynthesis lauroyl acyltransferase n=1 Tax=Rhizobium anhuiense TaxID=1184720 RepID=A0ABX4IY35_9HYPH|nr:hypothetical protein [Rhizobium anhuiense]PDS40863.1 hypothetical protein CO668_32040 [Rhizobium anhuiense]PDS47835.1 hypothetical protein CO662_32875 [Rhizobium anhuiense]
MVEEVVVVRRHFRADVSKSAEFQLADNAAYVQSIIDCVLEIPEFQGSDHIRRYFKPAVEGGRSIIFATAHWGNYLKTFNLIGNSFPEGAKFVALRGDRWNDDEDRLWAEINRRSVNSIYIHRVLDRGSLIKVIRDLKAGVNAFLLFDLFSKFGKTAPLRIFEWEVNFTNRWIDMAYKSGSIVCLLKPISLHRQAPQVHSVMDAIGFSAAGSFMDACMSSCAKCLEELILEDPDFWFMWKDLDQYMSLPIQTDRDAFD